MMDGCYHPAANLFPLLEGAEFDALCQDIAANGLLEPIWLHPDGSILDGRNRYRACQALGIEPRYRRWEGEGSPVDFVVSLNLHRRHLTPGQRAMLGADVLPLKEAEASDRRLAAQNNEAGRAVKEIIPELVAGQSRDVAGALVGVNGRYVSKAKRIQEAAPDLAAEVRAGQKNIPWAMRVLAERESQERARARQEEPAARPPEGRPPVRLMVGDAAALDLPDESVDVIITSPPYNLGDEQWPMGGHGREARAGIGYTGHEDALEDRAYEAWQLRVLAELYRVARPGASLFYNHKTRTRGGMLLHPMTWLCRVEGWTLRQEIVWDREVTHNHSATLFWPIDERVYWFTKGRPALYAESIGLPSVWRFHGPRPYQWHPAPFPEELPRRCLQAIGGQGLVVLDPFAGSCSTLAAALALGHEAIGVDVCGEYLERAKEEHGW